RPESREALGSHRVSGVHLPRMYAPSASRLPVWSEYTLQSKNAAGSLPRIRQSSHSPPSTPPAHTASVGTPAGREGGCGPACSHDRMLMAPSSAVDALHRPLRLVTSSLSNTVSRGGAAAAMRSTPCWRSPLRLP